MPINTDTANTISQVRVSSTKLAMRKKKRMSPSYGVGTSFLDCYKLSGDILGEGSCGTVRTCINIQTGTEFAVKIVSKLSEYFSRSHILSEIELYHQCRQENNIIRLIDFYEENDCFYLVFEKMWGGSLLRQIKRRGKFTEGETVSIIRDLARGLNYLHGLGVVHRDIKPQNILCVKDNVSQVKLCDFDLSYIPTDFNSTTIPNLMSPVGTLDFMPPEIVNILITDSDESILCYTKSCDMWSLGVLIYILLTGVTPFLEQCSDSNCGWNMGEDCYYCRQTVLYDISRGLPSYPRHLWDGISNQAKRLVCSLLVKDPRKRLTASQVLTHPWIQSYETR